MNTIERRRITVEHVDGIAVVGFLDRKILEDRVIQQLGAELVSLVEEGNKKILLNFQGVVYLSSVALGKLVTLRRKVEQVGGKLVLCGIDRETFDVFRVAKLDDYFNYVVDLPCGLSVLRA